MINRNLPKINRHAERLTTSWLKQSGTRTSPRTAQSIRQCQRIQSFTCARAIVKKYKYQARCNEFRKLKTIVPKVAQNEKASEKDILDETVQYIEELHAKLLLMVRSQGLPTLLKGQCDEATQSKTEWTSDDLKTLLHKSLQPVLEQSVQEKRQQDEHCLRRVLLHSAVVMQERSNIL